MSKKKTETIKAIDLRSGPDYKTGEIMVLTNGDARLAFKIGKDVILPDFHAAMVAAILRAPHQVMLAASRVYHRERGALELLNETIAQLRDEAFDEIAEPNKAETTDETPSQSE